MKKLFTLFSLLLVFAGHAYSDQNPKAYDGYVLKAEKGKMEVTVLFLAPKESKKAVLIFKNTGTDWDNKAVLHDIENGGKSFTAKYDGNEKEILHEDQYGRQTLYPPKYFGDGYVMIQDKKSTKALDLDTEIKKYKP